VTYELCIARNARDPLLARSFGRKVLSNQGRAKLRAAGLGLP
jgi:hypothetical protein